MDQTIEQLLRDIDPDSVDDVTSAYYELSEMMEENGWDFEETMMWLLGMLTEGERPSNVTETVSILLEHFSEEISHNSELVKLSCTAVQHCLASPIPGLRSSVSALLASLASSAWGVDAPPGGNDDPDWRGMLVEPLLQAAAHLQEYNYGVTVLPDGTVQEAEVVTPPAAMGSLVALQMLLEHELPMWGWRVLMAPGVLQALQHLCVPLPQDSAAAPLQYSDILASQQVTSRARAALVRFASRAPGTELNLDGGAAAGDAAQDATDCIPIDASWLKDPHLCTAGTSATAGNWHGTGQSRFARTAPQLAAQVLGGIIQYSVQDDPQWDELQAAFASEALHLAVTQWLFNDSAELVAVRQRVAAASLLGYIGIGLEYATHSMAEGSEERFIAATPTFGAAGLLSLALSRITRLCFPVYEPSFPVRSAALWALSHTLGLLHDIAMERLLPKTQEEGPDALPESVLALRQADALRQRGLYLPLMDLQGAKWVHGQPVPLLCLKRTVGPPVVEGGPAECVLGGLPPPLAWLHNTCLAFPADSAFDGLTAAMQQVQGQAPSTPSALGGGGGAPPVPATPSTSLEATAATAAHSDSDSDDEEEEDEGDMPPAQLEHVAAAVSGRAVEGGHPQDPHGSPAARGLCAAVLNGPSADMHTEPWDAYVQRWTHEPGPQLLRDLGVLCSDSDLSSGGVVPPPGAEAISGDGSPWDFDLQQSGTVVPQSLCEESFQAQLLCALLVNVQPGCPTAWTEHMYDTVSTAHFVLRISPFRLRIAGADRLFQVSIPRFSDSLLQLQKTRRGSLPLQWAAWLGWHAANKQGGMQHCTAAPSSLATAISQLLQDGDEADSAGEESEEEAEEGGAGSPGGGQHALALRWVKRQQAVDQALRHSTHLSAHDEAGLQRMRRVLLLQGRWLRGDLWTDSSPVRAFSLHSLVASVASNITGSTALEGSLRCLPGATVSVLRKLLPVWRDMVAPLADKGATSPEAFKLLGAMFTTAPNNDSATAAARAQLAAASSGAGGRPAPASAALRFVLTTVANTVQSTSQVPTDIAAEILRLCVLTAEWGLLCLTSSPLQGSTSPEQLQPHPEGGPMPAPAAAQKVMSQAEKQTYQGQLDAMQNKAFLRRCLVGSGWLLPRGVAVHVTMAALDILSFVVDSVKSQLGDMLREAHLSWRMFRVLLLGMSVFEQPGTSAVLHGSIGPVTNAWLGKRGAKGSAAPAAATSAGDAGAADPVAQLQAMLTACPDLGCSLAQAASLLSRLHGVGISLHGTPLAPADASPSEGFGGVPPDEDQQWGDPAAEATLQEAEEEASTQMQASMHGTTAGRAMQCGWADVDGTAADDSGSTHAQGRPGFFALCHGAVQSSALAVFGNAIKHAAGCFAPSVLQAEASEHTLNTLKDIAAGVMPHMQKGGPIPPLALLFVARSVRRATALVTGDISHLKPWGAAAAAGSSFAEQFALPEVCEAPPVTALALLMRLGGVLPHTLLPQSVNLPVPWPVVDPLSGEMEWAGAPHRMQSTPPSEAALPLVQAMSCDLASRAARTSAVMQRSLALQRLVGETPLHVNIMFAASMMAARLGALLGPLADPSSLPVTRSGAFALHNLWHSMRDVMRLCHPKVAFLRPGGGEMGGGGGHDMHGQSLHATLSSAVNALSGNSDSSAVLEAAAPAPSDGDGFAVPGSAEWLQENLQEYLYSQAAEEGADPALLAVVQSMEEQGPGVLSLQQMQQILASAVGAEGPSIPPATPLDVDATIAAPSSTWAKRFSKGSLASGVENAVQAVAAIVSRRLAAGRPAGIQGFMFEAWCSAVRCSPFMDAMDERFEALIPLLAAVQTQPELACPALTVVAPRDTPSHQLIEDWPAPSEGSPALPNGWGFSPVSQSLVSEPLGVTVDATSFLCFMGAAVSAQLQCKPPSAAEVGVRSTAVLPDDKVHQLQSAVRSAMAAVRSAMVRRVTAGLVEGGSPHVQLVGAAASADAGTRKQLVAAVAGAVFSASLAAVPASFTKLFMPVLGGSASAPPPSSKTPPPANGGDAAQ